MNKSQIINKIVTNNKFLSKDDVDASIKLILGIIGDTLSKSGRVELRGFGSFSTKEREKRISRNPKTGKSISVQKKIHPYFRASKSLKSVINN